jgi:hypothetical protein
MTVTSDQLYRRVGAEGVHQPIAAPLTASVTVYRNTIALLDGTTRYLKNADSPAATDKVIGMVGSAAGGTAPNYNQGITGGSTNGAVVVDCETGTFLLASGTGADALTEADAGNDVYVVDSITVGKTNGGSTRPVAGEMLPIDVTTPTGYVAVKLTGAAGNGP